MDDHAFRKHADDALGKLYRRLADASDDYDFDVDFQSGAISVEFNAPPAKFVISPNSSVHQVWVSARSRSYKLDWSEVEQAFVLEESGQTLKALLEEAISKHLRTEVEL